MHRLFAFFGVSAVLWLLYFFFVSYMYPQLQERGLFGDSFGAFSALFTGLALAGTAFAIYRQDEQTSDHERQLDKQAELQQRTAVALERNSTIELVVLINQMREQNTTEIVSSLKFLKAASRDPNAAAAVRETAISAKHAVAAQRLLMDAHNRSLQALVSAWELPIDLANALASRDKPHDLEAWEDMIDGLMAKNGADRTDAT
ncbi:MAG: hypothetical protein M0R33_11005 [Methylomonas sp.]|jgi:chaperone required for assembly of F1-ATPase|uniref:hypothetical protein n=1 Tax=Methylomonas sp. TaxID=418 RepID=UPI0025F95CE0|nr:hypothetical protein [Methylomonas sp.]MCK9606960.1 hypothetical protein [Methylomonas sp.]